MKRASFVVPILVLLLTSTVGARAQTVLTTVELPAIPADALYCLMYEDCEREGKQAAMSPWFRLPGTDGLGGTLISERYARGEAGLPGEGLFLHVYAVTHTAATGERLEDCVERVILPFGPHEPFDFDGDGTLEDAAFVDIFAGFPVDWRHPTLVRRTGASIELIFEDPICPAVNPRLPGQTSGYVVFASPNPAWQVTATIVSVDGESVEVAATAPASHPTAGLRELRLVIEGLPDASFGPRHRAVAERIHLLNRIDSLIHSTCGPSSDSEEEEVMPMACRAFENPLIGFENPLIGFENPLIAFDNPLVALSASRGCLQSSRISTASPLRGLMRNTVGEPVDPAIPGSDWMPHPSRLRIVDDPSTPSDELAEVRRAFTLANNLLAIWGTGGISRESMTTCFPDVCFLEAIELPPRD